MKKILSLVLCLLFLLPGVFCFAEPAPQPDSDPASNSNSVVERAFQECGKPYKWGAVGPNEYDASGLVSYCLTGVHARLGTTSTFLSWPRVIDPQPGDICTSMSHCGIYIGDAKMIHAPTFGQVVQIGPIQSDMIFVRYPGNENPGAGNENSVKSSSDYTDNAGQTLNNIPSQEQSPIGEIRAPEDAVQNKTVIETSPNTGIGTDSGVTAAAVILIMAAAGLNIVLSERKMKK